MAALTSIQLRWLHDNLGDQVSDVDLQTRYDDLGSVRDVGLAVLREQRRALLASPLSVTASGVASVNNTENVKALERDIAAMTKLDSDPSDNPGDGDDPADVVDEGASISAQQPFTLVRSRGR